MRLLQENLITSLWCCFIIHYLSIVPCTGKKGNTAKVFSALSWSWSSKSLPFTRESVDSGGSGEPCRPGAHCITLKKLLDEETKLYKEVKVKFFLGIFSQPKLDR